MRSNLVRAILFIIALAPAAGAQDATKRSMTFLDMQNMRQASAPSVSPDKSLVLYTISTPDWKEARRQTDIAHSSNRE